MAVPNLISEIERAMGARVCETQPLGVGFGLEGLKAQLADGRRIAVKANMVDGRGQLDLEAFMLGELARHSDLPGPEVFHSADDLLIMAWIENDGGPIVETTEHHAAELLAQLHAKPFERFGYGSDTLIGPLPQPNGQRDSWIGCFRDRRLLHMARVAHREGYLPAQLLNRIEQLACNLEDYLIEPAYSALIHGDVWGGNVLVHRERIAGFVDPAIYIAHPEIELAFTTMFGTFGRAFFDAYEALNPLEPGFHDLRRGIYNLYPTLVHLRLFGTSYLRSIGETLDRVGQ